MQACADICQGVWQVLARLADIRLAVLLGLPRLADICQFAKHFCEESPDLPTFLKKM